MECHEKEGHEIFFCHISESETHILYRFITHVNYFKPLFLEIVMIMSYR